jgi:hypothetical protein
MKLPQCTFLTTATCPTLLSQRHSSISPISVSCPSGSRISAKHLRARRLIIPKKTLTGIAVETVIAEALAMTVAEAVAATKATVGPAAPRQAIESPLSAPPVRALTPVVQVHPARETTAVARPPARVVTDPVTVTAEARAMTAALARPMMRVRVRFLASR